MAKFIVCLASLVSDLGSTFPMKDIGTIEVSKLGSSPHLSQAKYAADLLHHLGLDGVKPLSTPSVTGSKLSKLVGTPAVYRRAVGALQYLTLSCPDVQYSVN